MTLDSTLSGEYANSYVSVAYADDYFSKHYDSDKTALWATFTNDQKEALLIDAVAIAIENLVFVAKSQFIDESNYTYNRATGTFVQFLGDYNTTPYRAVSTQALQFPRSVDIDSTTGNFFIPEDVKAAQCEQAVFLAQQLDDETIENNFKGLKTESVTVGPIKLFQEFDSTREIKPLAPAASQRLKKYLLTNFGGATLLRA